MNPPPNNPPPEVSTRDFSSGRRQFPAVVLIVFGALLFLDNLGLIPFAHLRAYWPLVFVAFGVVQLNRRRGTCCIVWPWTMIALGILLTLGNIGLRVVNMRTLWPLFLIAVGLSMLFRRPGWGRRPGSDRRPYGNFAPGERFQGRTSDNIHHENAAFASINRRVDSPNFEGADLNVTFGELKLDLRGATISTPNKQAIVETNASFGAIKLRVPESWKIVVEGSAVFGAYEDKTVPPRPVPGIDPPTLIIRGNASFGAVEIEN